MFDMRRTMEEPLKRTLSGGVAVVAVVSAAFLMPSLGVCILLAAISTLAILEFYRLMEMTGVKSFKGLGVLSGGLVIVVTWISRMQEIGGRWEPEPALLAMLVVAVFLRLFPQKHNGRPLHTAASTVFGVLYVSVLFNYLTKLLYAWEPAGVLSPVGPTGRLFFFYLLAVVKFSDIGAYLVGSRWGRHKLIPRISLGKTMEGCAGGVASGLVASLVFFLAGQGRMGAVSMSALDAAVLGILLPLLGLAGDLSESVLKRSAGMKDSSSIIPGLGGVLDILDSMLFTVPALYFYAVHVLASPT